MTRRHVAVIGGAMIRLGRYPDATYGDLARPAIQGAIRDAGITSDAIEAIWVGHVLGGSLTGQRILRSAGISGRPVINVENACASGATALHQAWAAVASGEYETVLVVGVEKLTQLGRGPLPLNPEDWEATNGMTLPALYAMRARRYLHDVGAGTADLAAVAVKAREHGARNPYAQVHEPTTIDEVLESRPVAEPLTLLQCCPIGDGAAAVVLQAAEMAPPSSVRILASVLESGRFTSGFRDMTTPEITVRAATRAYEAAGIGPDDVDVAEVHDAFSIAELLYYEALGFCERGDAVDLLRSGATSLGGKIPVNPSGGLLAKGHPVGATGVIQAVDVLRQLQGRAGAHQQVDGARVGLTHATGGGLAGFDHGACSIHLLAR